MNLSKIIKYIFIFILSIGFIYILVQLILAGYTNAWTGFGEYTFIITSSASNLTAPVIEFRASKTLWDWLELLIAPIVLAGLVTTFNWMVQKAQKQTQHELKLVKMQIDSELKLASEQRQDKLLQSLGQSLES